MIKIDSFYNEANHSITLKGIASLRSAIIPKHQYNHLLQGERELSHPDRRILILKKRQCKASVVRTNLNMNVIKLILLLMVLSTSFMRIKNLLNQLSNTIEIKKLMKNIY